ncbi:hypothetical protein KC343_g12972 [Hortaea werneckii]|nr:hypothetical protein KC352_g23607 [Hortaea werneckii]KAI7555028.1 hypothetical protein KC317_g13121 [Hortaea werneckii]KAI7601328.1 hypothetical protein KC346_g12867 [Hortaea werneckii]KAI7607718.1 hypothetical protein KC343_g12972 [Hortaea werneckii]KAI7643397.1 hypothetical protein KC319_g12665 [Hortaea werneckii]
MRFFSLFVLASTATAAGTDRPFQERATQQCGQYQTQYNGPYSLATNGWGWSTGTGSQCSEVNSVSGNTIAWDTTWTWSGGPTSVKSYTNVQQQSYPKKQLGQYSSMPTTWKWSYTGTNLAANVAYDTFVGTSPNGANAFEVMVWLGLYGSISPLSSNGYPFTPIASPVINGVQFDLASGLNGNVKVYSFVARSRAATSFSGDFLNFYKYLQQNYASNGFNSNLYLQAFQAGTEVFTGSNAKFDTSAYSVSIS